MAVLLYGGAPERLDDRRRRDLEDAAGPLDVVITEDRDVMARRRDEVVAAAREIPLQFLVSAPRLRWYQHWYAGVERLAADPELRARSLVVTNARGVHAEPVAEHVLGMLLAFARRLHSSVRNQVTATWHRYTSRDMDELAGKTILVVGLGAIGSRIAELARAFGMEVIGVRRRPGGPVRCVGLRDLPAVLPEADVVVCTLPLTDETRGLFDRAAFAAMKPGAWFVNVGRGGHVDQAALIDALASGRLGAAGLDVTDPEPLPPDSPLWSMENVIITPHTGGFTPRYGDRVWPLFLENVRRFNEGQELINVVDLTAGY